MGLSSERKSEAKQTFKNFHVMVQNQYNTKIKILCTNNNIGYFNTILEGIC